MNQKAHLTVIPQSDTTTYESNQPRWGRDVVGRTTRERAAKHPGVIFWFAGEQSAILETARAVEECLNYEGARTYLLEPANTRHGICADIAEGDSASYATRVADAAKLCLDAGLIVLVAVETPTRADRQRARSLVMHDDFIEIACTVPSGAAFEPSIAPEITVDILDTSIDSRVQAVMKGLEQRKVWISNNGITVTGAISTIMAV